MIIKYYTVTDSQDDYIDFEYKSKLNKGIFPCLKLIKNDPDSLYFTELKDIHLLYEYGSYLREVIPQSDDPKFEMKTVNGKYKANLIVLGNMYSLFEIETYQKYNLDPSKNNKLCSYAALYGNFETLKWAKSLNCKMTTLTCAYAAKSGCFEILKWLKQVDCPWDSLTLTFAALGRSESQFEILKWCRENGCEWDNQTCTAAVKSGDFKILKWLIENGCKPNKYTAANAALYGYLDILKWLKEIGCSWNYYTCAYAAKGGYLDILKWARENDCEWNSLTCAYAALTGNLDILKWARENGCEWDHLVCEYAVKNKNLDVLEWAIENGAPYNKSKIDIDDILRQKQNMSNRLNDFIAFAQSTMGINLVRIFQPI
jgi:hypothetical protein